MSVHSFTGSTPISSYYSHGQVKVIKSVTKYMWTINNFCICRKKNGECIDSPIISAGADGEHRWRILLFPRGKNEDYKEYLSICVFLLSCNESKLDVHVKFSIVNDKKEECNERIVEHHLHRGKGTGCLDFIKRDFILDKANGLLPEGHLTILCEISTGTYHINSANTSKIMQELSVAETRLSDDLERLLENEKYSDVTLKSENVKFPAHKDILYARSPVLASMFEKNENKNEFALEDVEPEVLREMLRYMYSGKVDHLSKNASNLLPVAEKYALDGLKSMCEESLSKSLSVDNAVNTLILADVNKAEKLKTHVIAFIIAHAKDVVESPGYKLLADSQQLHLLAEVFRVLALQNH